MEEFSLFDHCVMLSYNDDVRERCLSFSCGDADLDDFSTTMQNDMLKS